MWSDLESNFDYLNFSEVAESIADIINTPELLPVSIGVFGDWGAGKSTILKLTETALNNQEQEYIHISFDAWLYQGYDDARASILETIAEALIKHVEKNKGPIDKAMALGKRVNKLRALSLSLDIGSTLLGMPTFGAIGKLTSLTQSTLSSDEVDPEQVIKDGVEGIKDAHSQTKGFFNKEENNSPPQEIAAFRKEYSELLADIGLPLVVYIDNLDRCTPINAIHTLEAIRLFLFMPNTAFVVAADEDMIRSAVREYHKGATERHQTDYLDKLIQVPINVPKPGQLEVRAYIFMLFALDYGVDKENLKIIHHNLLESLRNSWKQKPITIDQLISNLSLSSTTELKRVLDIAERITPLLASSSRINGNPRIVKRLLNVIKMRKKVSDRRKMNLDESLITKLVIFERCAGKEATLEFYKQIDKGEGFPELIKQLEASEKGITLPNSWQQIEGFLSKWIVLQPLLTDVDLRAAAYLSRETIPLGVVSSILSSAAKDLVDILRAVKTRSSPNAIKAIQATPTEDYQSVMDELIIPLRAISDWNNKPSGLGGALLLANSNKECKQSLYSFLSSLPKQRWLSAIIKELTE